ncbi:type II/IV secretion system ATPase subunit [Natrinema salaciae]|uniref:Flagellar protein FlaI n=1 Tax=Natrinema salaciae TaxID=1186196 RepID=A0A1H9M8G7_9EURY|nr:type II/IV secretion system ATPase subunit [Natrinema salaciae]SER19871.1 flagellar protein FlaI [Natrinema salaciae]
MSDFGTARLENELDALADEHPHLREHLEWFFEEYGEYPKLIDEPSGEWESDRPNVIYEAEAPIFCHVHGDLGIDTTYYCVEPTLEDEDKALYNRIRQRILDKSVTRPAPADDEEFEDHLDDLLDEVVEITSGITGQSIGRLKSLGTSKIALSRDQFTRLRYQLQRDIVGLGPLEPVMVDTANEDIHVIGPTQCYLDHGTYGMISATVDFGTPEEFEQWLRNMGERMNHPISDSDPVIDATLPDGSRINIIYSDDVSVQGPSLTIRQGEEIPLSVFQITKWGTLSPELAAYLWLCLENEQTVFVVGETASGKTTTLNAALSFIPRDAKIYTAEDTSEVIPPHNTWQQLLTREGSGDESADVDMFDLVAAALRSRPDYIVVGEVRGAEGQMAFQAAQTGHPVMLTFHASDIVSMIQRFTGAPINVPETFMDNCDVALFQNRVKQGDDVLRRVTSVQEIEGYSDYEGGVVTRQAFKWDPRDDEVTFTGRNNSYVLEEQIATLLGYQDTREIYDELDRRSEIIRQLIDADVLGYHEVNKAIADFQRDGLEGLPIRISGIDQFA